MSKHRKFFVAHVTCLNTHKAKIGLNVNCSHFCLEVLQDFVAEQGNGTHFA